MPGSFLDTNVLVYLASSDANKADRAEALIAAGGTISVQVLNEAINVLRRKLQFSWDETRAFLEPLRALLTVEPLIVETHDLGLWVAERHRLAIFDAMIVASALQASCDVLWSEDIHHGAIIDGRLRIQNPFVA